MGLVGSGSSKAENTKGPEPQASLHFPKYLMYFPKYMMAVTIMIMEVWGSWTSMNHEPRRTAISLVRAHLYSQAPRNRTEEKKRGSPYFLVEFCAVVVALLASPGDGVAHASRMPGPDAGHFPQPFVGFPRELLGVPPTGHPWRTEGRRVMERGGEQPGP